MATTSKVSVTEGAGKEVAVYSFTEDALIKLLQRIVLSDSAGNEVVLASATLANNQVAMSASAQTVVAARTGRVSCIIKNVGNNIVWIGIATVTKSNGFALNPGEGVTIDGSALVQGICDTGLTSTVAYMEAY